jgi:tetratricopeptide (TPR) repeat protein
MILILTESLLMILSTRFRPIIFSLISFLTLFAFTSKAQNRDSLRSLIQDRFPANLTLAVEYSERDFLFEPYEEKTVDVLSMERLVALKDSFKLTGEINYMVRIGNLYKRLNYAQTGYEWLYKALDQYYVALEENPNSVELLTEVIDLHLALNQQDYAIEKTELLLEINPDDAKLVVSNIALHLFSDNPDEAVSIANAAAKKFPDHPAVVFMQTMTLVQREIQLLSSIGGIEEAQKMWKRFTLDLTHLEEARTNYPEKVDLQVAILSSELLVFFYGKIIPAFFGGDIGSAGYKFPLDDADKVKLNFLEDEFTALLKHKTFHNKYSLYYSLGIIKILNSKYKKSIPYFESAIREKKPMYRGAHNHASSSFNNIFAAYAFMGKKDKARVSAQAKIDERPAGDPVASHYFELAQLKIGVEEFDEAKKLLQETLAIDSTSINAYVSLANIYLIEGNLELAEEQMDLAQARSSNNPEVYKTAITYYVYKGEFTAAQELLQGILDYDPTDDFGLRMKWILDNMEVIER